MKKILAVTGGLIFAGGIIMLIVFKISVFASLTGFLTYFLFHR